MIDPLGDPQTLRLLTTLLRIRPATMEQARALHGVEEQLEVSLDRLGGFVQRHGDDLHYSDPADVAVALGGMIELLPELTRHWVQGGVDAPLRVEVIHGHQQQWEAWARHAALTPPRRPFNAYPTLDVLREVIAPGLEAAAAPYEAQGRAVVPASAVEGEDDRALFDTLGRAGIEVRLAGRVSSWFYSDPEVLCALPLHWGEHPPSSIMIVHDPAIRAVAAAHADLLWAAAEPYSAASPEREQVLRLLGTGMSDRSIAAACGVSVRTIERRIAEAMAHHQVGTRFELGAAWASSRMD